MKIKATMAAALFGGAVSMFFGIAFADDDDYRGKSWGRYSKSGVAAVNNKSYKEECGSCHMAYPAGLLPAQSWEKIMQTLDDHFGENAELAAADRNRILNYLLNESAGRSDYKTSNKMIRNIRHAPMRITELPYFRHEHRELPKRMVSGNPKVRSFSNCDACHTGAERGSFNEHEINIPGYGRYDD